jgi:hypothetical protein
MSANDNALGPNELRSFAAYLSKKVPFVSDGPRSEDLDKRRVIVADVRDIHISVPVESDIERAISRSKIRKRRYVAVRAWSEDGYGIITIGIIDVEIA